MSDDSTAPADLSNIGIDLSQIFRPAWTTEPSDEARRLAAKYNDGDHAERPDHRSGGRFGNKPRARDSRGQGNDRGTPNKRDPRDGQKSRPEGRGARDRRDSTVPRPEPLAKPTLEGWSLELLPEASAIDGIAKQIRSRSKAYPLFELARLIVQLSDRYSVKMHSSSESSPELFRVKLDDSIWTSRKEAVTHLLSAHFGRFYRRTTLASEPPKGAFAVVAQCGMSGTLLGPPNHHEYTKRIIALHTSSFRNMPFELYKSRIRMMRDEALIEQWKTEQSTKTVYVPISQEESIPTQQPSPERIISKPDETISGTSPQSDDITNGSVDAETPAEAPVTGFPPDDLLKESSEASSPSPDDKAKEEPAASLHEPTEVDPPSQAEADGLSLEEATAHFNEHHADDAVEAAGREFIVKGRVALHGSSQLLRELLLQTLQEMDRFPLPLAQIVGKELTQRGLHLFKSHKKIINVSVARPRYLDREKTPIADGFSAILKYLELHPKQPRDKQWAGLLALRMESVNSVIDNPEAMKSGAEETLKRCETSLGTDILWLLHQGHVIDFAMGNLQAATRPAPKTPPRNHSPEEEKPAAEQALMNTHPATQTPDAGAEQISDSSNEITPEKPIEVSSPTAQLGLPEHITEQATEAFNSNPLPNSQIRQTEEA